ncbi:glycosyltransferase [Pelagicoccus albus]|uniref:Glycosyltransferase n=1 Tax=Pelagicoccus albus TaxID=415222 RepID=A0A7X1B780_9BACT|nr:glycosyltransferase [Pelagicoccus albus]MBC2606927.1 glycosyltransferase [Pelagicoccus albus]
MPLDISILIPARDASQTIERCVRSLLDQDAREIILIDDFSSDNTVEIAQNAAGGKLRVVSPNEHINVPHARNAGLDVVQSKYGIWCDADDCFLPGRVAHLYQLLETSGAQFATDGQELYDGASGEKLRDLPIPSFIRRDQDKARLFERNYLPGIGHIAFDVSLARKVGYDNQQFGGDDSDFLFRYIAAGAKMAVSEKIGYRMYAYPGSDSRNIARQKKMVARALKKHDYSFVEKLYRNGGYSERVTHWGLVSMAIFREEYDAAFDFLQSAFPPTSSLSETLEPQGPYAVPEGWRYRFTLGTLALLCNNAELAIKPLEDSLEILRSADTLNNLGVAYAQLGQKDKSLSILKESLSLFPGYLDAKINHSCNSEPQITSHPLRLQPSRSDY